MSVTDFVPPRVGDVVRVTLEGTVTSTRKFVHDGGQIELTMSPGMVGFTGSVRWGDSVFPEVRVIRAAYRPGDVADITRSSGVVERAMFLRYPNGEEVWKTLSGATLRALATSQIKLVFPAECGEGS